MFVQYNSITYIDWGAHRFPDFWTILDFSLEGRHCFPSIKHTRTNHECFVLSLVLVRHRFRGAHRFPSICCCKMLRLKVAHVSDGQNLWLEGPLGGMVRVGPLPPSKILKQRGGLTQTADLSNPHDCLLLVIPCFDGYSNRKNLFSSTKPWV